MPPFYLKNIALFLFTVFFSMPTALADDSSPVVYVKSDEELENVLQNATTPVLIDFYATWCGPCKRISPAVEEEAKKFKGRVLVVKVDVDEVRKLYDEKDIRYIPTFLQVAKSSNGLEMSEPITNPGSDELPDLMAKTQKLTFAPKVLEERKQEIVIDYPKLLPELKLECDIQETEKSIIELKKLYAIADSEKQQEEAKKAHEASFDKINSDMRRILAHWYKDLIERKGVGYEPLSKYEDANTSQLKLELPLLTQRLGKFKECGGGIKFWFDETVLKIEASEITHANPYPGESGQGHIHLSLVQYPLEKMEPLKKLLVKSDEYMNLLPIFTSDSTNARYDHLGTRGTPVNAMNRIDAFLSSVLDLESCIATAEQDSIKADLQKKIQELDDEKLGLNTRDLDCKKVQTDFAESKKVDATNTNESGNTEQPESASSLK